MTEKIFPAEINELAQVLVFLEEELDKAGEALQEVFNIL